MTLATIATVCAVYFAVVGVIGWAAARRTGSGAEEYFLGGRSARTVVLFMALLGTNVTPFVLMGIPGLSYHAGVGVFGQNAAIVALGIPLTFWLVGDPAWRVSRRLGAITPAELYAERLGSPAVGLVMFSAFVVYTLPYLVTSVLGVGVAVSTLTGDAVSLPTAAAFILALTLLYTAAGGMRATMWTNVFQGAVFMAFITVAFVLVAYKMGGVGEAMARVASDAPELLSKGERPKFAAGASASWGLAISLTVIAFPHMLVRLFAARDIGAIRATCVLYPPALVLLWVPAVMFGVWGATVLPGLAGRESDAVFPLMIQAFMGPFGQGLALAGILAAVMSSIDAQFLTLSSMLGRDVVRRLRPELSEAAEVRLGRVFLVAIAGLTWVIVVARPASIFEIASFSFSGYVTLVPTLLLGVRWRRFTAAGAIASILLGNAVLLSLWGHNVAGLLPVAWGLLAAVLAAVGVSLATAPPPASVVERAMGPLK